MIDITIVQPDIIWEDVDANLDASDRVLDSLKDHTDLILMPEMFTTGFTMRSQELAEPMEGKTMRWMADRAGQLKCDLTGSLIIKDGGKYYNRLIWMFPDGRYQQYDKRHLFRMSGENEHYSCGMETLLVQSMGARIKPLICYDLRFPVWSRNRQDYDILVYIANWPSPRRDVWRTLLKARALENQAYVIGVNRVGRDGTGIEYAGDSLAFNAKGEEIACLDQGIPSLLTIQISLDELNKFRDKFPVWKDADSFSLED